MQVIADGLRRYAQVRGDLLILKAQPGQANALDLYKRQTVRHSRAPPPLS